MPRTYKPRILAGETHPRLGMRPKTGGRRKGTPNKSTLAMRKTVLQVFADRPGGRMATCSRLKGSRSPPASPGCAGSTSAQGTTWSSHGAGAFGRMRAAYEEPRVRRVRREPPDRRRRLDPLN
jgi:hypothetical protein